MFDQDIEEKAGPLDETMFTDLYNQYWEKVFSICYAHLEDVDVAKEIVQDIFKSVWERRDTLTFTHSVERYLLRSAKLKVFEYIRNKQIRTTHLKRLADEAGRETNVTEDLVMHRCLSETLVSLVNALPYNYQRVFRMSRERGLSTKEIAEELLISERTAAYHLASALKQLRSRLNDYAL